MGRTIERRHRDAFGQDTGFDDIPAKLSDQQRALRDDWIAHQAEAAADHSPLTCTTCHDLSAAYGRVSR